MQRHPFLKLGLLVSLFTAGSFTHAQTTLTQSFMVTNNAPAGIVDIVVEADTYTPLSYQGRAEPTPGSQIRLIAIPLDAPSGNLTYSWRIGGRIIPLTENVATVTGSFDGSLPVQLSVLHDGRLWAQTNQTINLSKPSVLLYEQNPLRGQSMIALANDYTLIGDEAEVVAVPYFTNRATESASLRGVWRIDGQAINTDGLWRRLILKRPENPKERYSVELEVTSPSGFMERLTTRFGLTMGL